jgi:acyl-CoA thioester hydrolase
MKFFDYQTRVRYGETDCMGISYYANYLVWFEAARTEYFRSLGFVYSEFEKQGIFLPVAEAQCRYAEPSVYDDLLTVRTAVSQMRQSSLRFEYHVFRNGGSKPIAAGYTIHVFSGRDFKPIRIPEMLKSKVELASLLS